jgi:hypothetical protein
VTFAILRVACLITLTLSQLKMFLQTMWNLHSILDAPKDSEHCVNSRRVRAEQLACWRKNLELNDPIMLTSSACTQGIRNERALECSGKPFQHKVADAVLLVTFGHSPILPILAGIS